MDDVPKVQLGRGRAVQRMWVKRACSAREGVQSLLLNYERE
jgi:hypothetical protein